jgi:hypothetical protein
MVVDEMMLADEMMMTDEIIMADVQVNTIRSEFLSQGMNHNEGGWPKVNNIILELFLIIPLI